LLCLVGKGGEREKEEGSFGEKGEIILW